MYSHGIYLRVPHTLQTTESDSFPSIQSTQPLVLATPYGNGELPRWSLLLPHLFLSTVSLQTIYLGTEQFHVLQLLFTVAAIKNILMIDLFVTK